MAFVLAPERIGEGKMERIAVWCQLKYLDAALDAASKDRQGRTHLDADRSADRTSSGGRRREEVRR